MVAKKPKKRRQVDGSAGQGTTVNMSGLAKLDEALRERGVNLKFSFSKPPVKLKRQANADMKKRRAARSKK
jgi:hypothetical protein